MFGEDELVKRDDVECEREFGYVDRISGPIIIAKKMFGSSINELVRVGDEQFIGEVIRLDNDLATIQLYTEKYTIAIGDPVFRTGKALSIELGPGIMTSIYDGIQRPIETIFNNTKSIYIAHNLNLPALNRSTLWEFLPDNRIRIGSHIMGGDIFGVVPETDLIKHKMMVHPKVKGTVNYIAPEGTYTIQDVILETECDGKTTKHTMVQTWPIREMRPVTERLIVNYPLLTGQRVLDLLYPSIQGGTMTIPDTAGCGKNLILQVLSKYSNSDATVYVGCGDREYVMTELLQAFPQLRIKVNGKEKSIMERTTLIGNTPNMSVAVREASIYTGITLSEYLRDMGYNVIIIADSISRWAEAIREISYRLNEIPAESGYPTYLSSRLTSFYERAGRVKCLGSPEREGSVSILGTISPLDAGDFSHPVTSTILNVTQVFWALDIKLAQRKHFPQVNWFVSFSQLTHLLDDYYQRNFPELISLRIKCKEILNKEENLLKRIQLSDKRLLTDVDRITLEVAQIIREDFLQQNSFSSYDQYCPLYKCVTMLRNLITFYDLARDALQTTSTSTTKITSNSIRINFNDLLQQLSSMKFKDTTKHDEQIIQRDLDHLHQRIKTSFQHFKLNVNKID